VEQSSNDKYNEKLATLNHAQTLSLAPMMEYTDRHFRHMLRLITKNTLLYSEMVTANALAWEMQEDDDHQVRRFLSQGQMASEGASVLQLGGSDPVQLGLASSKVAMDEEGRWDYTAINLNCGCPSPKVAGKGCFGAALMKEPTLVRDLTRAMYEGSAKEMPITVKCRIGTDDDNFEDDSALYSSLCNFVDTVASGGVVDNFQVHARIAILNRNLSPAQNRSVPPLKYKLVHRLAREFPELKISINGGVDSIYEVQEQFERCPELAGAMVGRALAASPWQFAMADQVLYDDDTETEVVKSRWELLERYGKHVDYEEAKWGAIKVRRFALKALQGLFHGEKNSKKFRIALDDIGSLPKKEMKDGLISGTPCSELILEAASKCLNEEVLYAKPEELTDESFEKYRKQKDDNARSVAVKEWQERRQREEQKQTA